jgi:hypothetical protein
MDRWTPEVEKMWQGRFNILHGPKDFTFYEFVYRLSQSDALYYLELAITEIRRLRDESKKET